MSVMSAFILSLIIAVLPSMSYAGEEVSSDSTNPCDVAFSMMGEAQAQRIADRVESNPALAKLTPERREVISQEIADVAMDGYAHPEKAIRVLTHMDGTPAAAEKQILATGNLGETETQRLKAGLDQAVAQIDEVRTDPELAPVLLDAAKESRDSEAEMVGLFSSVEIKAKAEGVPKSRWKRLLQAACPKQ